MTHVNLVCMGNLCSVSVSVSDPTASTSASSSRSFSFIGFRGVGGAGDGAGGESMENSSAWGQKGGVSMENLLSLEPDVLELAS